MFFTGEGSTQFFIAALHMRKLNTSLMIVIAVPAVAISQAWPLPKRSSTSDTSGPHFSLTASLRSSIAITANFFPPRPGHHLLHYTQSSPLVPFASGPSTSWSVDPHLRTAISTSLSPSITSPNGQKPCPPSTVPLTLLPVSLSTMLSLDSGSLNSWSRTMDHTLKIPFGMNYPPSSSSNTSFPRLTTLKGTVKSKRLTKY